ncbi:unnamed protein product [Macrosiphum euphorbiae]|uniref:Endonuclease/exonuclease/phosphatase domain-containing protein n=1 Tax=Macrosiphum euphorbiae TaxID=13131 RepID=A0AAV0WUC8_9HEMI|nr:unnamed protein product [Macrosiphum euphorbiae]
METYVQKGMGSSSIYVTLSTQATARGVTNWLVSDVTDSDHRLLNYTVDIAPNTSQGFKRFDVRRADWDSFSQELAISVLSVQTTVGVNEHASTLTDAIIAAATKAIPSKPSRRWIIQRQPWWSDRLTSMRKTLNANKRQGTDATRQTGIQPSEK